MQKSCGKSVTSFRFYLYIYNVIDYKNRHKKFLCTLKAVWVFPFLVSRALYGLKLLAIRVFCSCELCLLIMYHIRTKYLYINDRPFHVSAIFLWKIISKTKMALFHGFVNFLTSGFIEDPWLLMRVSTFSLLLCQICPAASGHFILYSPENKCEDCLSIMTNGFHFTDSF